MIVTEALSAQRPTRPENTDLNSFPYAHLSTFKTVYRGGGGNETSKLSLSQPFTLRKNDLEWKRRDRFGQKDGRCKKKEKKKKEGVRERKKNKERRKEVKERLE